MAAWPVCPPKGLILMLYINKEEDVCNKQIIMKIFDMLFNQKAFLWFASEGRCHEVAVVTNPPQPVYLSPQHKLLGGLLLFVKQCS